MESRSTKKKKSAEDDKVSGALSSEHCHITQKDNQQLYYNFVIFGLCSAQ